MKIKRENTHLNDEQVNTLKNMLLKIKQGITTNLKKNISNCNIQRNETKDCVDEANENILISYNVRLTNRENLYLKKVEKSLIKIKSGKYGICDDCGDHIPFSRLNARLTSDLCIVCKEEAENEELHNYFGRKSKSLGQSIQVSKR